MHSPEKRQGVGFPCISSAPAQGAAASSRRKGNAETQPAAAAASVRAIRHWAGLCCRERLPAEPTWHVHVPQRRRGVPGVQVRVGHAVHVPAGLHVSEATLDNVGVALVPPREVAALHLLRGGQQAGQETGWQDGTATA